MNRADAIPIAYPGDRPSDDPIGRRCVVNLDSVESVAVSMLVERVERFSDTRMQQICAALSVAVDCQ